MYEANALRCSSFAILVVVGASVRSRSQDGRFVDKYAANEGRCHRDEIACENCGIERSKRVIKEKYVGNGEGAWAKRGD